MNESKENAEKLLIEILNDISPNASINEIKVSRLIDHIIQAILNEPVTSTKAVDIRDVLKAAIYKIDTNASR